MKKTRPSKNKRKKGTSKNKRKKSAKKPNPQIITRAVRTLRTVGDQEAFYFYEAIGKPTGHIARNLPDFLDKIKIVKPESLAFHLQRRDFQNWVRKILGDPKLAKELTRIRSSRSDDIRTKICKTVENRVKELGESSAAILVSDNLNVLLPPC